MTTQLPDTPVTNGHNALAAAPTFPSADGVRTYRGRRLEDLVPQIRAELGPDAIILREREGLVGGVGGFFAQRCIEVDARPGGPSVNLYDDDDDDLSLDQLLGGTPHPQLGLPAAFAERLDAEIASATAFADLHDDDFVLDTPNPTLDAIGRVRDAIERGHDEMAETEPEAVAEPEPETAAPVTVAAQPAPQSAPEPPPTAAAKPAAKPRTRAAAKPKAQTQPKPAPKRRLSRSRRIPTTTPCELDRTAAGLVARTLTGAGLTEAWAGELIVSSGTHATPFAPAGDLADAVRATLARSLPLPHQLPHGGAVVAFVGAGGAGKTSAAAALAAAYGRASTMPVTAIALGGRDEGRELRELLTGHNVAVSAYPTAQAAIAHIEQARNGGLVVIDTAAPGPVAEGSIEQLAVELSTLGVHATFAALPATLGARSAMRLFDAFQQLGVTGIALTHVDETDQLGVALELSTTRRLPITYLHEGTDVSTSLSAPDPAALAARLL